MHGNELHSQTVETCRGEGRSATPSRRRIVHFAALALILFGGTLRVVLALRSAVSYDEVHVMGTGLEQLAQSSRDFWIDVPLLRSNAIAPLWWWLQATPSSISGLVSLAGLRSLPVLFGTATLVLTWFISARRFGRRTALILLAFVALSDVHVFTSARGECVETLLLFAAIPAACWLGDWRRPILKTLLWAVLPLSHLPKGSAILAMLFAGELIFHAIRKCRRIPWAILAAGTCACVPIGVWLVAARAIAFSDGPIAADAGPFQSLWQYIAGLTTGYSSTKAHMVGSAWDSAMIFFHGRIWPFTVMTCVPLAAGIGLGLTLGLIRMRRNRSALLVCHCSVSSGGHECARTPDPRRVPHPRYCEGGGQKAGSVGPGPRTDRAALAISLLPWCVVGPMLVLGRGLIGSRFHLLYLPAWWLVASLAWGQRQTLRRTTLVIIGCVWILHVAAGFSMTSWSNRDWRLEVDSFEVWVPFVFVLLVVSMLTRARSLRARSSERAPATPLPPRERGAGFWDRFLRGAATLVATILGGAIAIQHGPVAWGPAARFEPTPGPSIDGRATFLSELESGWKQGRDFPSADNTSFWVYMTNAHLKRPDATPMDAQWAVRYSAAAVQHDPTDAQAWAYLGFAYQREGRPKEVIRGAWERSHELRPDLRLAELIRKLDEVPSFDAGQNHDRSEPRP